MPDHLYDDRPHMASVPLTAEDVDALLLTDGSAFARDPRRVRHLLSRTHAAFKAHRAQVKSLQRDVETIAASARRTKTPVAAVVRALADLSTDEQRQVYDLRGAALLDALAANALRSPASPASVSRCAPAAHAMRVISASPRVTSRGPNLQPDIKEKPGRSEEHTSELQSH